MTSKQSNTLDLHGTLYSDFRKVCTRMKISLEGWGTNPVSHLIAKGSGIVYPDTARGQVTRAGRELFKTHRKIA